MEPMIYKPGAYKSPGVYKGTGGVYKDGAGDFVEIGGRKYPFVKIDSLLWITENLDWKFTGCVIGATGYSYNEPRGNYFNNDETTYGINGKKYGLLYNWIAAKSIDSLLSNGWRVPSLSDFSALASFCNNDASKIKSTETWNPAGNNETGFTAVPNGTFSSYDDSFGNLDIGCDYWTTNETSSSHANDRYLRNGNNNISLGNDRKADQYAIRLCKDA